MVGIVALTSASRRTELDFRVISVKSWTVLLEKKPLPPVPEELSLQLLIRRNLEQRGSRAPRGELKERVPEELDVLQPWSNTTSSAVSVLDSSTIHEASPKSKRNLSAG